ncbi:hypothetical protein ONZ45_g15732 [Pleurotus djamor]|nr:hypothetical protein ONZ45_g15732 [Pleurotus djamor]
MKIVVTGCNGSVGSRVVDCALKSGHTVLGVDQKSKEDGTTVSHVNFSYREMDLRDYEAVVDIVRGYDGIIHLAGCPNPLDYAVKAHNVNVVLSWNILRAAAEVSTHVDVDRCRHNQFRSPSLNNFHDSKQVGITRVAQASSVNAITMVYSQQPNFLYFPIDEDHPCLPDEPYGLSKVICELQADTIVRRYPSLRVASLRLHWSVPCKDYVKRLDDIKASRDLWGYVQEDSAAEAFLLAITVGGREEENIEAETGLNWSGHERFFIVAPQIAHDEDADMLRRKYWPEVELKNGKAFTERQSFFDL